MNNERCHVDSAQTRLTAVRRDEFSGDIWKLVTHWHSRASAGSEFQMDGAAPEKARRAMLVLVQVTTRIGAEDDHSMHEMNR